MDFSEIWSVASEWIAGIALVATGLKAIDTLLGSGRGFSAWREKRRERKRALGRLVDAADRLECTAEHGQQIQELSQSVSGLTTNVDRLANQVASQDTQIRESLEERCHLSKCVLALTQHAIDSGANGYMHEAHDELAEYLHDRAHTIMH